MREQVLELWPEMEWIQDLDLREKTIRTWERAFELSPLEPGIYEVYVHYWLDSPMIDGGDWDGDGKMDKLNGTLVESTVTIFVK